MSNQQDNQVQESPENIFLQRTSKAEELREAGVQPFGERFDGAGKIADARASYREDCEDEQKVRVAGRLMGRRIMGNAIFADLKDSSGRIQLFISKKIVGTDEFKMFKKLFDIGDILGIDGELFATKTGELSVKVKELTLLSKSLHSLPEKFHGLTNVEQRYRQRYLDLIMSDESRDVFLQRFQIIREIRKFLENKGFLEVETPMLQPMAGGASANPFKTYYEALSSEMFMRIAPELYLKRLLVGGFEKVYELNRNFRNEGMSRRHNPEFTMIEWYRKDISFSSFLDEVIALISLFLPSLPVKIASYRETFCTFTQIDYINVSNEDLYLYIQKNIPISFDIKDFDKDDLLHLIFSHVVEPHLGKNEFFVLTDFPASQAALSKIIQKGDEKVAKRFEVFYECIELANGYHELIDPIEQKNRLIKENEERVKRGKKSYSIDEKFIHALENMGDYHGVSIGFDRLMMLKNNCNDIDQVLSFSWKNL